MARSDEPDRLAAQEERSGALPAQGADGGSRALQLDMFGPPVDRGREPDPASVRADLLEVLGEPPAPAAPENDEAQLRLEFVRPEPARLNAA